MTKVDEPMPNVVMDTLERNGTFDRETTEAPAVLSGIDWLRDYLSRGRYGICGEHYHGECIECGSVKCLGMSQYHEYETATQVCDCKNGESVEHTIVPFDHFGQHVGFPR